MTYKGYIARVGFDERDAIFVRRILGITNVIGFHGETVKELSVAFLEAVEDYLDLCAKIAPLETGQWKHDAANTAECSPFRADRRRSQGQKPQPAGC
jgi:hypothetical protein